MSQPEWMKKFQEIGQKGEEEVTSGGNGGFVKSTEQRRAADSVTGGDAKSVESEEDVAALFYSKGAPKPDEPPEEESFDEESVSDDDANSEEAVDEDPSELPSMTTATSSAMRSTSSSGMPSSTTVSSSGMPSTTTEGTTSEASSAMRSTTTSRDIEDLGDSWQQNRTSDIDSLAAAEVAKEPPFHPGESFITEEILVDEDGNEIEEVQEGEGGGGEEEEEDDDDAEEPEEDESVADTQDDDEILYDEDDNELEPEEQRSGGGDVEYTPDAYEDARALPGGTTQVYDVEEQRQILGAGNKGKSSRMSWCIPLLFFAIILASVLVVLFLVVFDEDKDAIIKGPVYPTEPTTYAQNGNDAAGTTVFDRLRNNCNLNAVQPNFIDQCNCVGSVDIVADDVRARWEFYAENFMPLFYPEWDEPITSCSPENQALLWMSSGINNGGEINDLLRLQRYILAVVFFQQGGIKWYRTRNWVSEQPVCEWEGVECDADSYVRILNLDQNNVKGKLSDAPTKLNAIEAYYAANNELTGPIPSAYFSNNTFRSIDFSGNALSGGLSKDLSTDSKIFALNIGANFLDGTIPSEINNIAGLQTFNIEGNEFTGTLPTSLYTLPLTELSVGGNKLTGPIPGDDLKSVSTLTSLSLGPNLFTGSIPTSLSQLTSLEKLSMVGIPEMNGRLPTEYALQLTNLVELSIADTSVGGDIPFQYTEMSNLETLRLSNNNIRGRIPPQMGLMSNLKSLSLNGNILTGTMPSTLGLLASIQELRLSSNEIYGTIPENFANLFEIQTLTFDNTFMDGRVPEGVCALRNAELTKLVVDCPTLVGESAVDGIICSIPDCCTECI